MRSGGVIALPSDVYEDANGRGTMRQWDIEFTKDAVNFEPFDKSFDYLDVQKLRSLWIPEQAFLEGKGGTSSRNVAAELGESSSNPRPSPPRSPSTSTAGSSRSGWP